LVAVRAMAPVADGQGPRDDEAGHDRAVDARGRREAGRDRERHRQRQRDEADRDAGDQVMSEGDGVVAAECENGFWGARAKGGSASDPAIAPDGKLQPGRNRVPAESLDPALVVRAYREGLFPMAMEDGRIGWFSPDPRGVVPLEVFHVPARLARVVRAGRFAVEIDRAFPEVMRQCAQRPDDGTWISDAIIECYTALHRLGLAHSVETWRDGRLVGGLYGVHLGGAFFGESMFHRETDASKVALVALVDRLRRRGFALLDVQWVNPHLVQFGAVDIPRAEYRRRLKHALARDCSFR
jgi:leucyl/phenylalanyl-tRNA--protein transferase